MISALLAHFNFLKRSGDPEYVGKTLKSKELYSVQETRQKSFWWKQGRYEATLLLSSPKKCQLAHSRYNQFVLSPTDIDHLKQNIATLETDLKNIINSNLPDFSAQPVDWNWANVDIKRVPAA